MLLHLDYTSLCFSFLFFFLTLHIYQHLFILIIYSICIYVYVLFNSSSSQTESLIEIKYISILVYIAVGFSEISVLLGTLCKNRKLVWKQQSSTQSWGGKNLRKKYAYNKTIQNKNDKNFIFLENSIFVFFSPSVILYIQDWSRALYRACCFLSHNITWLILALLLLIVCVCICTPVTNIKSKGFYQFCCNCFFSNCANL